MAECTCARCSASFHAGRSDALFCPPCKPIVQRERERRWARENRERANAAKRRWRLANPEAMKAARAKWEADNVEIRRRYRRHTKKKDPISNRSYVRARRARKSALSVVPFTAEQLRQRLAFYDGRCWMCGREAEVIDHVKPLSKGGAHMLCNLRPACDECNTRKGARWPFPTSLSSSRGAREIQAATVLAIGR